MPKKRLTVEAVEKIKPPKSGRLELPDAIVPGMSLRVTSKGQKSWAMLYRVAGEGGEGKNGCALRGKLRRLTLGSYPLVDLANARKKARDALEMADRGIDPAEAKRRDVAERRAVQGFTFGSVADEFVRLYCKPNLRSWRAIQRTLDLHVLSRWGDRPISDITRRDAIVLIDEIKAAGIPHAAGDVLKRTRVLFDWACDRYPIEINPFAGLKPKKLGVQSLKRDRVLGIEESKAVWKAAGDLGYPFGPMFMLLMLLGQRRNEIARVRWSWLGTVGNDPIIPTLEIPAEFYKTKRVHIVPLPPLAMEIVEELPRFNGDFMFTTMAGERPVSGFSKAKRRLDESSGVTGWRIHDLRRTVSTQLGALRIDQMVNDAVLGHAIPGVRGIYNRYDFLPEKYVSLCTWARALESIIRPAADNVVIMPCRKTDG